MTPAAVHTGRAQQLSFDSASSIRHSLHIPSASPSVIQHHPLCPYRSASIF